MTWLWSVGCTKCDAIGPSCPDRETAITYWNKRATLDEADKNTRSLSKTAQALTRPEYEQAIANPYDPFDFRS